MDQRILVLNPSTSAYLVLYEDESGDLFFDGSIDAIKKPDMRSFLNMVRLLGKWQWDYDYGDEYTLQRHAKMEGEKLTVQQQSYSVALLSGDMKNMFASTVSLLEDFAATGGRIICVGNPGLYIDGLIHREVYALLDNIWEKCSA